MRSKHGHTARESLEYTRSAIPTNVMFPAFLGSRLHGTASAHLGISCPRPDGLQTKRHSSANRRPTSAMDAAKLTDTLISHYLVAKSPRPTLHRLLQALEIKLGKDMVRLAASELLVSLFLIYAQSSCALPTCPREPQVFVAAQLMQHPRDLPQGSSAYTADFLQAVQPARHWPRFA